MSRPRYLVTGATGFVGSHVAELCVQRGYEVVTVARPHSDTAFLDQLGVHVVRGDLLDDQAIREAMVGVDVVIHCAAKVGDWGHVDDYRAVNVAGFEKLLRAACGRPLERFVYLSSLGVYQARDHFGTTEEEPPPIRQMDGYTQSKVEAEQLALLYQRQDHLPIVILRPGFIYGPRDRTVLPKLIDSLRKRQVIYIGSGRQRMNTIYVGNLVDAIFLAVTAPNAVGQIYNLTDDEEISKQRFLEAIADLAGLERPKHHVWRWVARITGSIMERYARWRGWQEPPRLTQGRFKFLGLHLHFNIDKAKRELGYQPRVRFEDGIEEAVTWWKAQQELREATAVVADTKPAATVNR